MTAQEKKDRATDLRLRRTYGISLAEYNSMIAEQGNRCWICGRFPKKLRLFTDHNHATGKVRRPLCFICNKKVIGVIEKYRVPVGRILEYFKRFDPENPVTGMEFIPAPPKKGTKKKRTNKNVSQSNNATRLMAAGV